MKKNEDLEAYTHQQKEEYYLSGHSTKSCKLLENLYQETYQTVLNPRMISGSVQGRFLSMVSKMMSPTIILEIGTYTGYATLCLAEGLQNNGKIYTIDINEELVPIQNKYFNQSSYKEKINILTGDAIELIPKIEECFDLVFIDAEKLEYIRYFDLVINKMNAGGLILSDNVLWNGKVVDGSQSDKTTEAIRSYNKYLSERDDIEVVILPLRDGISLARVL